MCDGHDLVEYEVSKLFLIKISSGLVVAHHVMHVLLLAHRIHHEELSSGLL